MLQFHLFIYFCILDSQNLIVKKAMGKAIGFASLRIEAKQYNFQFHSKLTNNEKVSV